MTWGFEEGKVYNRRTAIHARFGGQQQGGIITPSQYLIIFIVTGDEGLEHGYADRMRDDGAFEYFGEGQIGDMTMQRGNFAIATHASTGKSLLLFRKTTDGLRYVSELVYEKHHIERAPDRVGNERDAIVFELRPLSAIVEDVDDRRADSPKTLEQLRILAKAAAGIFSPTQIAGTRNVYQRSRDVRNYVLMRSAGDCEGCNSPAPFVRKNGSPYLEPHHIRRVSDGGPDDPAFVIALCPNCHRRVHAGKDGAIYNDTLLAKMRDIETN